MHERHCDRLSPFGTSLVTACCHHCCYRALVTSCYRLLPSVLQCTACRRLLTLMLPHTNAIVTTCCNLELCLLPLVIIVVTMRVRNCYLLYLLLPLLVPCGRAIVTAYYTCFYHARTQLSPLVTIRNFACYRCCYHARIVTA